MSDTKLRELERRWKETGSPDDEAAYLLERVRVGDLTQERLELAAYCGHEGARRATGLAAEPFSKPWYGGLKTIGPDEQCRVALAAARAVQEKFTELFPADQRVEAALAAAEACLLCPCDLHGEALRRSIPGLVAAIEQRDRRADYYRGARAAACAALAAAEAVALRSGLGVLHWSESTAEALTTVLKQCVGSGVLRDGSRPAAHMSMLIEALVAEVSSWALGADDAISVRVNDKQA